MKLLLLDIPHPLWKNLKIWQHSALLSGYSEEEKKWLFSSPGGHSWSQLSPSLPPIWSLTLPVDNRLCIVHLHCLLAAFVTSWYTWPQQTPPEPIPKYRPMWTELIFFSGKNRAQGSQHMLLEPQLPPFKSWLCCHLAGGHFSSPDPQFPGAHSRTKFLLPQPVAFIIVLGG